MTIERTETIQWHNEGTLRAVTRWITGHEDGLAELLKNARRAYQADRLDVDLAHRAVLLLLRDKGEGVDAPARMGVLDVGGAMVEDMEAWSVWHDPTASHRSSGVEEEETQGQGGKAYLYAMFEGQCRFLGVNEGKRNGKGFEGPPLSEERGTPGWIPSEAMGRDVVVASVTAELNEALRPYNLTVSDLPAIMQKAIQERGAFTLVEGTSPTGLYKGRIDSTDLVSGLLRHEQATLVVEQMDVFAVHNGTFLNNGKPLQLPEIPPYPGLELPQVFEIPEELPLNGSLVSTTEGGSKPKGRLVLLTAKDNMFWAWKVLRPRWKMSYRAGKQMIGAKGISELAPGNPGANFIYGTIELPSLDPAYVETGRKRPKDGPLLEAVEAFAAEKINELAKKINELRREELDQKALDEVHQENQKLDSFKNSFLPQGVGDSGTGDDGQDGNKQTRTTNKQPKPGAPATLEYSIPGDGLHVGLGVEIQLAYHLGVRVLDDKGRPVPSVQLEWSTSDLKVGVVHGQALEGVSKGKCDVWVRVKGTELESEHVPVTIWLVEHVFLAPREMTIKVGERSEVTAEVTDDDGARSTDVLLDWKHDAVDQGIVRVGTRGWVTGEKEGRTAVTAGAAGMWAKRPVEVLVVASDKRQQPGGGFPRLLLTDRDIDEVTGKIREGSPDDPALWQGPSDFVRNVWWLNIQSPEASFAFSQRSTNQMLWRLFHVERLMEMVEFVWLAHEFTEKGEDEPPAIWSNHRAALERRKVSTVHAMWSKLHEYVTGGKLDTE